MSTRSGASYKKGEIEMAQEGELDLNQMLKTLIEERQLREKELAEKRSRREEEAVRREEERREENHRREEEAA